MPLNKSFEHRIEIIDECLRNRYKKWTLQDIIDNVNERLSDRYDTTASKRTIQNDIKYLEEEKGAPIERKREGAITYFSYADPNYSVKNIPIKEEEINYLNDVINILRQVSDFKIIDDVEGIIKKLQNTVSTNIEGGPAIIQFEKHTVAAGTEYIDDIFTAIKEKVALRITYQSFNAQEANELIFHPYLLREYRNRWFLIGRKDELDCVTVLALDRIKKIKNSSTPFLTNDLFNPETYFNNLIGVTFPDGEEIQEVDIKVSTKQAPYIRTKPIHHTQEIIQEYENGDVLIRLWLICNYELRSVLLSYGCDIEVIKPGFLREKMKEAFQKGINCYK